MRILITGVDDQGRSCVVEERSPDDPPSAAGIRVSLAAETPSSPPPPRPPGRGDLVPIVRGPGIARWSFVEFAAHSNAGLHHTDSVDFDVILEGSVDIVLDDGPHRLEVGDGVVVHGSDHGWATQAAPARRSVDGIRP